VRGVFVAGLVTAAGLLRFQEAIAAAPSPVVRTQGAEIYPVGEATP